MENRFLKRLGVYYVGTLVVLLCLAAYGFVSGVKSPAGGELVLIYAAVAVALFMVFALIAIGHYVYHDAERRGMSPVLWTLISVFAPYFIGLIVYLVVRTPLPTRCPSCGCAAPKDSVFCPKCGKPLRQKCSACQAVLQEGDRFCTSCGAAIEAR